MWSVTIEAHCVSGGLKETLKLSASVYNWGGLLWIYVLF